MNTSGVISSHLHLLDVESQDAKEEDAEDVDDCETQADQTSEEQLQGDVLDGPGLLQGSQVLGMVAESLQEQGDLRLGLGAVTSYWNLQKFSRMFSLII